LAISLRMLGIPARVAEGFTPGGQDADDRYVVSDRDAHAWVEVLFPRLGWVPFEPTPTRSLPSVASSTSPQFLDSATQALGGVGRVDEFLGSAGGTAEQRRREEAQARAGATGEALDPASIADAAPWRPGFFTYALLGLAGLVSLVPLAKRARTLRAYVSRDPHRIAAAVRSDLVGYVQDQQPRNGHAALTPNELARLLDRDFSVDARGWVRQQTRARYGPDGPAAAEAARAARSEARGVKRELRRTLTAGERLSGALRLRSLIP
jgi:hypothetical protein